MTEHPLSFSADMVRALLDGRKTQTRTVMIELIIDRTESPSSIATMLRRLLDDGYIRHIGHNGQRPVFAITELGLATYAARNPDGAGNISQQNNKI